MRKEVGNSVIIVVVANKIDLERSVSTSEGMSRASELEALYIETSAKTGEKVNELYTLIFQVVPLLNGKFNMNELTKGLVLQEPRRSRGCACQ